MSCKITKAGRNPYGDVLSAVLIVAGLTRPARFSDDSVVLLIKDEALPPAIVSKLTLIRASRNYHQ